MTTNTAVAAETTLAIDIENADDDMPQTCLDSGNATFYGLYAEFDPAARKVSFGEDHPSVNGTPFKVYHGRVIRFSAPEGADAEQVRAVLITDEIQGMLARLANAYSCEWNGNNHVGTFGDDDDDSDLSREDAQSLIQSIANEIEQISPAWTCCRFDEWVEPAKESILAELGGDASKIPALVEQIEQEARAEQGGILVGDGERLLRRWLEELSQPD